MLSRTQLADRLMFRVGRYHDEDSVDVLYRRAAAALRVADAEIKALEARLGEKSVQIVEGVKALALTAPDTGMQWVPVSTVEAVAFHRETHDA